MFDHPIWTYRSHIGPTLKALLDALPFGVTAENGVEAPRQLMRQMPPAAEMLSEMRIEERMISHSRPASELIDIPARIHWRPVPLHQICRSWSFTTVAAGRWATWTRMRRWPGRTLSARRPTSCRWISGWLPSTPPGGGR
jgi:hypothetical protein